MILLFPENTTLFTTNGLGALSDAISCKVDWENNGVFELEMTYPADGLHFKDLSYGRIILAEPSPKIQPQPFVIYKITEPMNGVVTVNAQHVIYNLLGVPMIPYEAASASAALAGMSSHMVVSTPFMFSCDGVTTQATFKPSTPASAREYLGGMEGSILDQFGGEYEFDRYRVILHKSRGSDKGVTLRYGKNLTDITQETNIESTVTGIFPYWTGEDTMVTGDLVYAANHENFPLENIDTVDVSSELSMDEGEVPTRAQVTAAGEKVLKNRTYIGVPSINISLKFAPLWQTEEYKDIAPLEEVEPCDTITVYFEKLDIEEKAKIHKTTYDCLKGRYESIEIGDIKKTIASTLATITEEIEDIADTVDENNKKTIVRMEALSDAIELEVSERESEDTYLKGQITITNSSITQEVIDRTNADAYLQGQVTTTAESVSAEVTNRISADSYLQGQITVNAGNIDLKVSRNNVISEINMSPESGVYINASRVALDAYVTFTNLSMNDGNTRINGSNITTGTIDASKVTVTNLNASNITSGTISGRSISGGTISGATITSGSGSQMARITDGEIRFGADSLYPAYINYNNTSGREFPLHIQCSEGIYVNSSNYHVKINAGDELHLKGNTIWMESGPVDIEKSLNVSGTITGNSNFALYDPGTNDGSANMHITTNGYVRKATGSSQRWKNSIKYELNEDMDPHKLYDIKVAQFKFNTDYFTDQLSRHYDKPVIGLIAEDLEKVYPMAVDYDEWGIPENWNFRYLIPPMIALIQEQHKEIENLKEEIRTLKSA